ncbi:lysine--tRNA ligase [Candidatus Marsarchaeota archaeon]|nr:lysine--tRNA ligase [Candidatus Marsarchaeota archaeon]MCL5404561.1 lysine--tRNA ligase [Candidatus Marsarchaeota archaeon]
MADDFKLEKLKKLQEHGINPYPYSFKQKAHAEEIKKDYAKWEGKNTSVAGRAVSIRHMGQLYFIDLLDQSGKIQILAAANITEKESFELLELIDSGDMLGVEGMVSKTKKGEISIEAKTVSMLGKSLRQLPEKFHGLSDTELRYRKRYLDLIANPEVRNFFTARARILSFLRNFLDSRGYVEFETPILQPTYGGANAQPFKTVYNALDSEFYLRISDELYLKRLIIGGFEKVYEVSKDFRNEDIDSTHNPEFTQIEFYEAYKDYNDFMEMTEEMLSTLVKELFGTHKVKYQGKELNFEPPFKRIYWVEEIKKKTGINLADLTDEEAKEIAKKEKLEIGIVNAYHVADALFDKYIKPELFDPAFVLDFPAYMCPLTKDKRGNPKLSERFELYLAGKEDANCYSELTDPIEQKKKFEEQDAERRKGDAEAPPSDEDFLEAIEYGMPPTAGLGIAIDRLAMILTDNVSIKEVLPFPAVRPLTQDKNG